MNLKCKLGLHEWQVTPATYVNSTSIIVDTPAKRVCVSCGKRQERHDHCLGLNPPEWVQEWRDVE